MKSRIFYWCYIEKGEDDDILSLTRILWMSNGTSHTKHRFDVLICSTVRGERGGKRDCDLRLTWMIVRFDLVSLGILGIAEVEGFCGSKDR